MKRIIAVLLIAMLTFSLVACAENTDKDQKETTVATSEPTEEMMTTDIGMSEIDGGWGDAQSIEVSDEIKTMFDKLNETLTGAQLYPIAYLESQIVAGTNHLVLCKEIPSLYDDALASYALVTVYEDLDGNAEVTQILESGVTAPVPYDPENPMAGAYAEPTTYEVTDEAKAALEKACETLAGAEYEAKALLATQIVAGTNYQLLCKTTATVPNAESYYTIVTVYADLNGGAEITDVAEFGVTEDGSDSEAAEDSAVNSDSSKAE